MNVFRIATKQAITEIIQDNAQSGKFGLLLTEDGLDAATTQLVDLFEMAINLRARTQGATSQEQPAEKTYEPSQSEADVTKSRWNVKLPRTAVEMNELEKQRLVR